MDIDGLSRRRQPFDLRTILMCVYYIQHVKPSKTINCKYYSNQLIKYINSFVDLLSDMIITASIVFAL